MVSENPPIFTPSGKGFKASYSLTFASDLQHHIYLMGGIQGDSVESKTLKIDNGKNASACVITLRGQDVPVGPYTVQYVDCRGVLDVIIKGGSPTALILVDVLTYVISENATINKNISIGGLPPISYVASLVTVNPGGNYNVLPLGTAVSFYVDVSVGSTTAFWGFASGQNLGGLTNGVTSRILIDCSANPLWFSNLAFGDTYKIVGA